MKIFADDAKIYYETDSTDTPLLMQDDLNRAELWAKIWDMIFNNKKCHHMHVGENIEVSKYEMGSGESRTEIQRVTSEKDLGVIIDGKLKVREHIVQKVNTANRNLGIIFRTFTYMDKEMFLNLYKSMVRPPPGISNTNLVTTIQKGQNLTGKCTETSNAFGKMCTTSSVS